MAAETVVILSTFILEAPVQCLQPLSLPVLYLLVRVVWRSLAAAVLSMWLLFGLDNSGLSVLKGLSSSSPTSISASGFSRTLFTFSSTAARKVTVGDNS